MKNPRARATVMTKCLEYIIDIVCQGKKQLGTIRVGQKRFWTSGQQARYGADRDGLPKGGVGFSTYGTDVHCVSRVHARHHGRFKLGPCRECTTMPHHFGDHVFLVACPREQGQRVVEQAPHPSQ